MNKILPLLAIGGLIALTACEDDVIDTDGDTDGVDTVDCNPDDVFPASGALSAGDYAGCNPYTGETLISYFPQPECSGNWTYDVELKGTAGSMVLYTYDNGGGFPYGEEHDLNDGAFEPNGWWDAWDQDLSIVTELDQQEPNVNSLHSCAANNGSTLLWAYAAFNDEGASDRADCVVVVESSTQEAWTADFYAYHDGANLSACDEISGWTPE